MTDKKHLIVRRPSEGTKLLPLWFAILDVAEHWCDWKLIQCGVLDDKNQPWHYGEGCIPQDLCTDIEKAEPTLSGFIKWDGCMEFRTSDGKTELRQQVHVCHGPEGAFEIFLAWNWLLTEAHKAMVEVRGDNGEGLLWEPLQLADEELEQYR